jgi:hypothetical protein
MQKPVHKDIEQFEFRAEPRLSLASAVAPGRQERSDQSGKRAVALPIRTFAHYLARPMLRLVPLIFAALSIAALFLGWTNREEGHLTAASGLGYWLGIVGGSMMLFMMIYPLRKRVKALRWLGSVPSWFRMHMVLGIVGPMLILFHANFRLGSLNSNVSLAAMLFVVASGVIGRYLYAKVHKGLYGRTANVREILSDTHALKAALGADLGDDATVTGPLHDELRDFEARALRPRQSFASSVWAFLYIGFLMRRSHARVMRQASELIEQDGKRLALSWWQKRQRKSAARLHLRLYFAAVRKAVRFAVFERLLALWHVLHLPLFILLVITAVIHIIAVHHY